VLSHFNDPMVELASFLILLSSDALLLPLGVGAAAWLRRGDGGGRVVAALALVYSLYALVGTGREPLLWGAALVAAGLPVYALQRRRAKAAAAPRP
jgi:APA family basic amino acid/polyamine antiporter